MNDTDPSPTGFAAQDALFTGKQIKVFIYNQQVTDDITTRYLNLAKQNTFPSLAVRDDCRASTRTEMDGGELTALQESGRERHFNGDIELDVRPPGCVGRRALRRRIDVSFSGHRVLSQVDLTTLGRTNSSA